VTNKYGYITNVKDTAKRRVIRSRRQYFGSTLWKQ